MNIDLTAFNYFFSLLLIFVVTLQKRLYNNINIFLITVSINFQQHEKFNIYNVLLKMFHPVSLFARLIKKA